MRLPLRPGRPREARIARKRQALETHLDALRHTLRRAESGLLSGKTPALAAVEVQNMTKRIVEEKGAQVRSIRVLRPQEGEEGIYVGIPVQATVLSNIRQLKDVLYAIESSENLFHVRELRVRAVGRRKQEDQIQSTLTIEGFLCDPIYGGNRNQVGWKAIGYLPRSHGRLKQPYRVL